MCNILNIKKIKTSINQWILYHFFICPIISEPLRNKSIDITFKYIEIKLDYKQSIKYIIPIIIHCFLGQNENRNGENQKKKD